MGSKEGNIKVILFDSGRVLNESATGHWFVSPKFFSYVDSEKYSAIDKDRKNIAFRKAGNYINCESFIKTKEEEYVHFKKYYEIFSESLPELRLNDIEIDGLAKDLVYNVDKYIFFNDALKVIPQLKEKYKLAIVSDAWPSLKGVYENKGLDKYFDSFVISSIIGVTKPNEKMYLKALEELRVLPEEAVFVDDNLNNCKGAMKLGIKGILLCRNKLQYYICKVLSIGKGYAVINSLEQLKYIKELNKRR